MPTRHITIPCPGLVRWRGRFTASVIGELEREGLKLAELLVEKLHGLVPSFTELSSENKMRDEDGWPKYISKRLAGSVGAVKVVEVRAEYVNHNPRDGESWELALTVWLPGGKKCIEVSTKDSSSTSEFEVAIGDDDLDVEPRVRAAVAGFSSSMIAKGR